MKTQHKNYNRCSHCKAVGTETTRIQHLPNCTNIGSRARNEEIMKMIHQKPEDMNFMEKTNKVLHTLNFVCLQDGEEAEKILKTIQTILELSKQTQGAK